jgi:glycosyltransferase involved in cell wall biosynthesis
LKRLYRGWEDLGTYVHAELDYRTHGPVYVGRAVRKVLDAHPEWVGQIHVNVYGKQYPASVTDAVLDAYDLQDIVALHGRVPHAEALQHMVESDLLFMALPDRVDGSPGSRISAKTYEYLTTDRPILAALPPGENREYLQDKPGVHLTPPDGVDEMASVIAEMAAAKFEGSSIAVDRSDLRPALSSTARAESFEEVFSRVLREKQPA